MSRFLKVFESKNLRILIGYGCIRSIVVVGSGLFAFYVLSFLSAPPRILGLIISIGFLASAIGSIVGGFLTDNFGRKRTLFLSSLLGGVGWITLSFSRDWRFVAFSYALINGMAASAFPTYTAVVSDSMPKDTGGGLGAFNTATSITSSIGAFLSATIAGYFGFKLLFWIISIPWFLSMLAIPRLEESMAKATPKPSEKARFNLFHMFRKNQGLFVLSLSVFLVTVGGYVADFYPDYVKREFDVGPVQMGVFDSVYSIVWAATNYPVGVLSDKGRRKRIVVAGYALMGIAWILFPIPDSILWLFVLYAVYSLGNSMGFFTTALVLDTTKEQAKGAAVGVFNFFMYLGVFLSGVLGGILWEGVGALTSFRISFTVFIGVALIINFFIRNH